MNNYINSTFVKRIHIHILNFNFIVSTLATTLMYTYLLKPGYGSAVSLCAG
jgi:hypothetical protein